MCTEQCINVQHINGRFTLNCTKARKLEYPWIWHNEAATAVWLSCSVLCFVCLGTFMLCYTIQGATLNRTKARKWAYQWENDTMELVRAAGSGEVSEVAEHGYTAEEVKEAVQIARRSDDIEAVHEAITVIRDVSASGLEACQDLVKKNVVQVLHTKLYVNAATCGTPHAGLVLRVEKGPCRIWVHLWRALVRCLEEEQ